MADHIWFANLNIMCWISYRWETKFSGNCTLSCLIIRLAITLSCYFKVIRIYIPDVYNITKENLKWNIVVLRWNSCKRNVLRSPPWLGWPLWNISVTNDHGYVPLVVSTSRSLPHSWLITGFVIRLTRRVPLVEHELLTLPDHLSSPPVFRAVRVTRSLVLCVMFCRSLFVLLFFYFWPLCCPSFFDLWIMITPLVSSNSS